MAYVSLQPIARKPEMAATYPGLSPEDTDLCTLYLARFGGKYQRALYNWPIGFEYLKGGIPEEEPWRSTALRNSALRMDFVGVPIVGERWDLVEFRANGGIGAIGSLMSYAALWPGEAPPHPRLILVTTFLRPVIAAIAKIYGIEAMQLP